MAGRERRRDDPPMGFTVQRCRQDPTLDLVVSDGATGAPTRMVVLSGVVAVGPESSAGGIRVSVSGQQPDGEAVGFYPPGAAPLPAEADVRAHAEVSLAQIAVDARIDNVHVLYGIGEVCVTMVPSEDGTARWPYLTFHCFGAQPMAVRYRVTILSPA